MGRSLLDILKGLKILQTYLPNHGSSRKVTHKGKLTIKVENFILILNRVLICPDINDTLTSNFMFCFQVKSKNQIPSKLRENIQNLQNLTE